MLEHTPLLSCRKEVSREEGEEIEQDSLSFAIFLVESGRYFTR